MTVAPINLPEPLPKFVTYRPTLIIGDVSGKVNRALSFMSKEYRSQISHNMNDSGAKRWSIIPSRGS